MVHAVKSLAPILLFFMLTTSLAWASNTGNYCRDFVADVPSVSDEGNVIQNKAHDTSGHCGHLGTHFLGQIVADSDLRSPLSAGLRLSETMPIKPAAAPRTTLFRPPRSSSSI